MTLLTALGIASAAGAAGKAGAGIYGAAQQFNQADRQRLAALERRRALKQLGLTDEEEALLERQLLQPVSTAQREGQQLLMQSLGVQDVGSATAARQLAALEAQAGTQRAAAIEQVQQQDALRRAEEAAEIRALEEQRRARRTGIATAGLTGAADLTAAAAQHAQAKQQAANQEALMQMFAAQAQSKEGSTAYLSAATAHQLQLLNLLKGE
jgi:hypothetical protein